MEIGAWGGGGLWVLVKGMLVAFHKPFGILSQFTADGSKHGNLSLFGFPKGVYPIGRLDAESEIARLRGECWWRCRSMHS